MKSKQNTADNELPKIISGNRLGRFWLLVANGILQAVLTLALTLLLKRGFDQLFVPENTDGSSSMWLWQFGAVSLSVLAFLAFLRWRGFVDGERLAQSYVHAVRLRLFRHILKIGADGIRQMSRGAVIVRFVGDLSALGRWVSLGLARLVVNIFAVGLALIVLIFIEPLVAMSIFGALFLVSLVIFAFGPVLTSQTAMVRKERGRMASFVNDRVAAIGVIEAFGQEQREAKRAKKLSRSMRDAIISRANYVGLLRASSEAGSTIASIGAFMIGAFLVGHQYATPGTVLAAMVVSGLLAPRMQEMARIFEYWKTAQVAQEKQQKLLDLKSLGRPKPHKKGKLVALDGEGHGASENALVLDNVSFRDIFKNVRLEIPEGSRVCIQGPNGAGKSTLLKIAAGIIQPSKGRVKLGGKRLTDYSWSDLRSEMAFVSSDLPLLRGSLRYNLFYGLPEANMELFTEIVEICALEPIISRLPDGIQSQVTEGGETFSQGERMQLSLARALMAQPRILFLDEADAHLDVTARACLEKIIASYPGTIIATTHGVPSGDLYDRLLRLENGKLRNLEKGNGQKRAARKS